MSDELIRKYEWVTDIEAWTIAVIKGRSFDEVVRIYGGDSSEPAGELSFAAVDERRAGHVEFYLRIVSHGDALVAIENDGYSGAFPEIARRCSVGGGELFSVYWNIHAAGVVTHAVDEAITARFESLFPIEPEPRGGDRRPDWAVGPEVEPQLAWQVSMAQLEQRTGVEVDPEWLRMPLPTYRIPDPYWLYRDLDGADRI